MEYGITNAVVIGAGVMGAGIAAHLANCGLKVLLLDRVPAGLSEKDSKKGLREDMSEWRNQIALTGIQDLVKLKRPVFKSEESSNRISVGNTEDDINKIGDYDWIIETIIEDLEIKKDLYANIEMYRKQGSVVSTNTSGIPISHISAEFSDELTQYFLGTHFFNPPTYVPLIEIIPGKETLPELVEFMVRFCLNCLGKQPLVVKDTPNFICNRLAIATVLNAFQLSKEKGITVEEADALCGKALGRHQGAIFGTADAVGLDTVAHVTHNIRENASHDERRDTFFVPQYVEIMIEKNLLGNKTRGGFYRIEKAPGEEARLMVLDLDSLEYRERIEPNFTSLQAADKVSTPAEKVKAVVYGTDAGALFAWEILANDLIYTVNRVGEIAETIVDIDNAMKWGYTWRLGPFECWDAIGLKQSVDRMKNEGRAVPVRVEEMLKNGFEKFYIYKEGARHNYDFRSNSYQPC